MLQLSTYDSDLSQAALRTSHGRRPPGTSGGRATTAAGLRIGTANQRGATGFATAMGGRPTTGCSLLK